MCVCKPSINPSSPSAENKAWSENNRGLPRSERSGGDVGGFLRAPDASAIALLPSWHPAPAGEVCRKADRSLDKLQVSEGWVLQGWPCPRARTCPQPGTLPINCSTAAFWETWGASPNWGGLPAVSPFLRTYQKQKAFSPILSGQPGSSVFGDQKSCIACLSF